MLNVYWRTPIQWRYSLILLFPQDSAIDVLTEDGAGTDQHVCRGMWHIT